MGLPGGDGRYRGTKDQVIHAALTNKTDTLENRADDMDFLLDDLMTNVIPNLIGGE